MCSADLRCRWFYLLTILILPHFRYLSVIVFCTIFLLHFTINLFATTFVERVNQDAKPKIGWDEFQAPRYRAWYHHRLVPPYLHASSLKPSHSGCQIHRAPNSLQQFQVDAWPNRPIFHTRLLLRAVIAFRNLLLKKLLNKWFGFASTEFILEEFVSDRKIKNVPSLKKIWYCQIEKYYSFYNESYVNIT